MTSVQRKTSVRSRREPTNKEIAKEIFDGYSPSDGCPPLKDHWGGYSLATIPWLGIFAKEIAGDESRKRAWNTLKRKCDTSFIIDLLYAFTRRAEVQVDQDREEANQTKEALDRTLKGYDKLRDEIQGIICNPEFSSSVNHHRVEFDRQLQFLRGSRQHMQALRDILAKWGSRKRDPRDWYLLLLSKHTMEAEGSRHDSELITLIEAAYAAHGKTRRVVTEATIAKQLLRTVRWLNGEISEGHVYFRFGGRIRTEFDPPAPTDTDDDPIPF